jgi:hypothetical protein
MSTQSIFAIAFVTALGGAFAAVAYGADDMGTSSAGIAPAVDAQGHERATDAAGEVGNGVTWILQQERERERLDSAGFPQYND